jgi:hypothetical protein
MGARLAAIKRKKEGDEKINRVNKKWPSSLHRRFIVASSSREAGNS